jgi:hypothetical protein
MTHFPSRRQWLRYAAFVPAGVAMGCNGAVSGQSQSNRDETTGADKQTETAGPSAPSAPKSSRSSINAKDSAMLQTVESLLGPVPRTSQIAFGQGRLAQLLPQAVVIRDTSTWKVAVELEAPKGAYAVGSCGDGSLVAVLVDQAVAHLPPDALEARRLPSVLSFGRDQTALILPAAGDRFWITSSKRTPIESYRTALAGGYIESTGDIKLKLFTNYRDATVLADGTIVVIDGNDLHTATSAATPAIHRGSFPLEGRVLGAPAAAGDQVWLASFDGTIALSSLPHPDQVLRSFSVDGFIKELISGPGNQLFATVWPDQRSPGKLFVVAMDGTTGRELWRDRVFAAVHDDLRPNDPLLLSTDLATDLVAGANPAGLVAVGGPRHLVVWHARTGERVELP